MKKSLIGGLVLTACFHAVGAANRNYTYLGVDAMGSANNVDRSVFIGSAAGYGSGYWPDGMDWGYNIINDVFIGGASGLQTFDINSSVGIGYHSLRTATSCSNVVAIGTKPFSTAKNCVNCVGIGADVFFGANGATNEVNINNQLFISPNQFWIRLNPNSTAEDFYFYGGNIVFDGNVLSINGDILVRELRAHFDHDIKIGHPEFGHGISLRDVAQRLVVIEQMLGISQPNLMSAPNPNTPTNTPTSH